MKLLCLLLFPCWLFAQDTLIKTSIYNSLYSKDYNIPKEVSYKLYQGGGECSRQSFRFHIDNIKLNISCKDYSHSGYDEGHMADAKDFAFDCTKEEMTFRFYNCVPQCPQLNRGIWKTYETKIRKLSQTDSLLIICGAVIDSNAQRYKTTNLFIPAQCYKVVYSLSTHELIYCLLFDNNITETVQNVSIDYLRKLTGCKL